MQWAVWHKGSSSGSALLTKNSEIQLSLDIIRAICWEIQETRQFYEHFSIKEMNKMLLRALGVYVYDLHAQGPTHPTDIKESLKRS